jgi:hypothetical protein
MGYEQSARFTDFFHSIVVSPFTLHRAPPRMPASDRHRAALTLPPGPLPHIRILYGYHRVVLVWVTREHAHAGSAMRIASASEGCPEGTAPKKEGLNKSRCATVAVGAFLPKFAQERVLRNVFQNQRFATGMKLHLPRGSRHLRSLTVVVLPGCSGDTRAVR